MGQHAGDQFRRRYIVARWELCEVVQPKKFGQLLEIFFAGEPAAPRQNVINKSGGLTISPPLAL
jgi:hypothetical protein